MKSQIEIMRYLAEQYKVFEEPAVNNIFEINLFSPNQLNPVGF